VLEKFQDTNSGIRKPKIEGETMQWPKDKQWTTIKHNIED
jgi:hypothetical protein